MKQHKNFRQKFHYAFQGLREGILSDKSIQTQLILAALAVVFFNFIGISLQEWLFVLTAVFMVIITEFFNSVIERVSDLIDEGYNSKIKQIKDMSAAAVLLAAIYALCVAIVIGVGRSR